MAWDLAKAMAKKGEFESARLADFEFRQRARTFRLMAEARGEDPSALVAMIAQKSDEAILEELAARDGQPLAMLFLRGGSLLAQTSARLPRCSGSVRPVRRR